MSTIYPDNMVSYVNFMGDRTFREKKLNNADIMLFTALIGEDIEDPEGVYGYTLKELAAKKAENTDEGPEGVPAARPENAPSGEDDEALLEARKTLVLNKMGDSPRFANVILRDYRAEIDKEKETTFYAATFLLSKHEVLIVFRGTDGTLMSWKENFNSLYKLPTPGQLMAREYLEKAIEVTVKKPFMKYYVTGHSKGGNLALYASMYADPRVKKKITHAFLYDAPGFLRDMREEPAFTEIKDRITSYVPEGCVIGKLMNQPCEPNVVRAAGKGVFQHDSFNWIVGPEGLAVAKTTNEFSERLSGQINEWIEHIPMKDREKVVNELFDVFRKNGIMHIQDLIHIDLKHLLGMLMSATMLSSENRSLLMIIFRELRS